MKLWTILLGTILLLGCFLQPLSYAKRVAVASRPDAGTTVSVGGAATLNLIPRPDITSRNGITIGGAIGGAGGHFSNWGGTIRLTASDALLISGGHCAFNLSYDMENIGTAMTTPEFLNRLRTGSNVVSIQSALSLDAGETRQINTQAYLPRGIHTLSLGLDSDHVVRETNEINNVRRVRIVVRCP
jgi:hypothetical protein